MSIEVTEDGRASRQSRKAPWTAYREFIVTGTTDDNAALVAVDGSTSLRVPQEDDSIAAGSYLKCEGPEIKDKKGLGYYVIGCNYSIKTTEGVSGNGNPLEEEPRVNWGVLRQSHQVDVDLDGRPICDTAGNLIANATREMGGFSFNITRPEPFFDIQMADAYSLCVNDRDIQIGGVTFRKYRLLLDYIIPQGDYTFSAKFVRMGYQFHYLPARILGEHPWQHRFMNAGDEGWYQGTDKSKGKFVNEAGEVVTGVRLDLTGKPIKIAGVTYRVGATTIQEPIANPTPQTLKMTTPGGEIDAHEALTSGSTTIGYALLFKKVEIKDLRPILF